MSATTFLLTKHSLSLWPSKKGARNIAFEHVQATVSLTNLHVVGALPVGQAECGGGDEGPGVQYPLLHQSPVRRRLRGDRATGH